MKRRDLVRTLEEMGCVLTRHGGKHDWYTNPNDTSSLNRFRGTTKSTSSWLNPLP